MRQFHVPLRAEEVGPRRAGFSLLVTLLLVLVGIVNLYPGPSDVASASIPVPISASAPPALEPVATPPWWEQTAMDKDGNRLHDGLDLALEQGRFIEEGRIGVLVDFDHTPTAEDELALSEVVDFEPRFRFHYLPIISGWVAVERITELLEVPGVVFLTHNGPVGLSLEEARAEHHVEPQVWDLGYDGAGVAVAIIDTGIDATHLSLNDFDDDMLTNDPKVVAFYDAINDPDTTDGSTPPYDDNGHGSHVSGIAAGTGEGSEEGYGAFYAGVAPGASLVGVKVLDGGGSGSFDQVMAGMEWTIDNQAKYNIRAASMSLGGAWVAELTQEQEERLTTLANEMVAAGIALTIAAGNSGAYGTIGTPGAAKDVITVGATEHDRELAVYSSKGPTHEGQIKPNVAAIGSSVWSVQANGPTHAEYRQMSGTSMATPLVAGMVALLLEANPDLQPLMVRSILEQTSEYRWLTHPVRPNNDYGWGFVEADAAMAEAVNIDPSLNVTLDPATPTRDFTETFEDENGTTHTVNSTRYLVRQGSALRFLVEGEPVALEWRDIDLEDVWHRVEPPGGRWAIAVDQAQFALGNMSLWVRAVNSEGQVSAPLYLSIVVEDPLPEAAEEDSPLLLYALPAVALAAAVVGWAWGRRGRET